MSNTRLRGFARRKEGILNPSAVLGLIKSSTVFPRQKNPQDLTCLLPVYPGKMLLHIQLLKKIGLLEFCWATSSSCLRIIPGEHVQIKKIRGVWFGFSFVGYL